MRKPRPYGVPPNNFACCKAVAGLEQPALSSSEKVVLATLAHFTDANGYCFPSQGMIAKKARVSRRTVQRALVALEGHRLIRKASRTRTGFRNGSCGYVVTVAVGTPTRQHLDCVRHADGPEGDTVSELNKPIEQTTEHISDPIRHVGDKLLEILASVIDFKQTPSMLSTAPVCRWLFNASRPSDFADRLAQVFEAALALREQLQRDGKLLNSWTPLMNRLQGKPEPLPKRVEISDEPDLSPLVAEFKAFLPAAMQQDQRFMAELNSLAACETAESIELASRSRMAIDRVYTVARPALRSLAQAYGKPVVLKHRGQVIQTVRLQ